MYFKKLSTFFTLNLFHHFVVVFLEFLSFSERHVFTASE